MAETNKAHEYVEAYNKHRIDEKALDDLTSIKEETTRKLNDGVETYCVIALNQLANIGFNDGWDMKRMLRAAESVRLAITFLNLKVGDMDAFFKREAYANKLAQACKDTVDSCLVECNGNDSPEIESQFRMLARDFGALVRECLEAVE